MEKKQKNIFGLVIVGGVLFFLLTRKPDEGINPKNNAEHLESLNPKFRYKFKLFLKRAGELGYMPQINSSYRNYARQVRLKKEDKRNASPNLSHHNYGVAIDVQFKKDGKRIDNNATNEQWQPIVNLAEQLGLSWGGNIVGYPDKVHFFVRGLDTKKLYSEALKQFKGVKPSKWRGNTLNIS